MKPIFKKIIWSVAALFWMPALFAQERVERTDDLPSGILIVLNKSDNTGHIIHLETGEPMAEIPTGLQPHEVAISPDGRTAVITNYGTQDEPGHTLAIADISGFTEADDISPDIDIYIETAELDLVEHTRPHGVQFLDDERVIVTAEGEQAVIIVHLETGEIEQIFTTGQRVSHMVAVSPDRAKAFVPNLGSANVTVLDLEGGEVVDHIHTGAGSEGVAVSPDGSEVWVTNRDDDTITVLDAKSLDKLAEIPASGFPIRVAFTPDGGRVLVSCARSGEVRVFDAKEKVPLGAVSLMDIADLTDDDDRYFVKEFEGSPIPIGILVAPGRAYVACSAADVVAEIDPESLQVIRVFPTGSQPDGIGRSPY